MLNQARKVNAKPFLRWISQTMKVIMVSVILLSMLYFIGVFILNGIVSKDNIIAFKEQFETRKMFWFFLRWMIYLVIYFGWPKLVMWKLRSKEYTQEIYQQILDNRNRFVIWFVFIEILVLLS